jgi:Fe2+ transport system protein FeoA
MLLTDLGIGQAGIITSIDTTDSQVQRLMVLGLVEGVVVEHISSVGNSTLELKISNNRIVFSKEQARHFTVEPV